MKKKQTSRKINLINKNSNGISKSSIRRRKRHARDSLQLSSLQEALNSTELLDNNLKNENKFKIETMKNNPFKPKKSKAIYNEESNRFHSILNAPEYKSNPLGAIQNAIKQNLKLSNSEKKI